MPVVWDTSRDLEVQITILPNARGCSISDGSFIGKKHGWSTVLQNITKCDAVDFESPIVRMEQFLVRARTEVCKDHAQCTQYIQQGRPLGMAHLFSLLSPLARVITSIQAELEDQRLDVSILVCEVNLCMGLVPK